MVVFGHVEAEPSRSLEQSSLAWDMLQEITLEGCYAPHSVRQESSPPSLTSLRPVVFFTHLSDLTVGPYAGSSELSYSPNISSSKNKFCPFLRAPPPPQNCAKVSAHYVIFAL